MADDRRRLNFSRTAEADGDLAGFDDDRHLAPAVGQLQHALKSLFVLQHIEVFERNLAASVGLPGAPV